MRHPGSSSEAFHSTLPSRSGWDAQSTPTCSGEGAARLSLGGGMEVAMNQPRGRPARDTDYFSAPNAVRLFFGLLASFVFALAGLQILTQPAGLAYIGLALLSIALAMPRR